MCVIPISYTNAEPPPPPHITILIQERECYIHSTAYLGSIVLPLLLLKDRTSITRQDPIPTYLTMALGQSLPLDSLSFLLNSTWTEYLELYGKSRR